MAIEFNDLVDTISVNTYAHTHIYYKLFFPEQTANNYQRVSFQNLCPAQPGTRRGSWG